MILGGLVGYINQKSRINWGAAVSHIPYVSGFRSYGYEDVPTGDNTTIKALADRTDIIRTFEDQFQVLELIHLVKYTVLSWAVHFRIIVTGLIDIAIITIRLGTT